MRRLGYTAPNERGVFNLLPARKRTAQRLGDWSMERPGLFIVEADLPDAAEYRIDIQYSPVWRVPTDDRVFTVNLSSIRLVLRD